MNVNYTNLRTGRTGSALFVVGIYLLGISLSILIPDKTEEVISSLNNIIRIKFLKHSMETFGNTTLGSAPTLFSVPPLLYSFH